MAQHILEIRRFEPKSCVFGSAEHIQVRKDIFPVFFLPFITNEYFYEHGDAFDADEKKLMAQGVAAFGGIAPTYRIALLDKPTIVWDFHSLLIGLQMMFSFMMAEDKTTLRMCDSCDTVFVANRKTQRFCCDKCRRKGE